MGGIGLSLMECEVLPIISLSCLQAGGDQVSAHLGEPRDWWRSSSRPWPQCLVSRWLARISFPFKKNGRFNYNFTLVVWVLTFLPSIFKILTS
ncbi:hypothetical protein Hanom_Chr16g01485221 [Helianthus anomalus]